MIVGAEVLRPPVQAMFNLEFLNAIREYELARIISHLSPRCRVLEIGGGTGFQARRLEMRGYDICSIDLATSNYAAQLEFPVRQYDGRTIPFPNASFDVVFSSNVLEHVLDPDGLHAEAHRVLKPGGVCVHVVPTAVWRSVTNVAHYVEMVQRCWMELRPVIAGRLDGQRVSWRVGMRNVGGIIRHYRVVPRHGERGNAFTEMFTFGRVAWRRHFANHGFRILKEEPVGLWYSGHMVLGPRLPIRVRHGLSRWMGSACYLFVVQRRLDAAKP